MSDIAFRRSGRVLISEWRGDLSESEVARAFDYLDRMLANQEPFAHVIDARFVGHVSAAVRELGASRLQQSGAQRRLHLRAEAVVLSSSLLRGILAAMYLLSRPGYPTRTFSDLSSAEAWARAQVSSDFP